MTAFPETSETYELRIEERKRLLRIESRLAEHHRAIAALAGELEHFGWFDLSETVTSSLWSLGVAIVRVAEQNSHP